ncbi:MAG: hypothetical protein K2M50_00985 [Treponemataceae bacterium]|nr:hypothetical protein [Treponemataceae bacterium]
MDKGDYLLAMERPPVKDTGIKTLLKIALTDKINDRTVYIKGIDASYFYERYSAFTMKELKNQQTFRTNQKEQFNGQIKDDIDGQSTGKHTEDSGVVPERRN